MIIPLAVFESTGLLYHSGYGYQPAAVDSNKHEGLMLDIVNPKLNWDSEQKAVKQNMNVMYNALVMQALAF